MAELFLFLSIFSICLTVGLCTGLAIRLHHVREKMKIDNHEQEVQRMHLLSSEGMKHGLLPPMFQETRLPPGTRLPNREY